MKKLLFTVLALGLAAGAFAQNTVDRAQAGANKGIDKMQEGVQRNNARMSRAAYSPNSLKGGMALGASVNYGTDIESLGIGLRYDWMISNSFRLTPNATFWIKNDDLSSWDINVDVQYLIPLSKRWTIYPLAGFTVSHWKYDSDVAGVEDWKDTYFGVNLGAGIQFDVAPDWFVNFDAKYRIIKHQDQLVLSLGFGYRF